MIHSKSYPDVSSALITDLYQLTMAQGYLAAGKAERQSIFHMFFRKAPFQGRHVVMAGLASFADWLENLHFSTADLAYLKSLVAGNGRPLFSSEFIDYLSKWRFSGTINAISEGSIVFPYEPLVRVHAPLLDAQLIETTLLCIINFQSLIATKASRMKHATGEDDLLEFGLRRAHGLDGGLSASRAAYIGGADATSNLQAGASFNIPVRGTHAHSWVMAFSDEPAAFKAYLDTFPHNSVLLIDTYDSLDGVKNAIEAGRELRQRGGELMGIRLDSGDLAWLSQKAREMLDEAGFQSTRIIVSNDLDEKLITSLKNQGAPIDGWGVGTRLATAFDEPALGGVYKLAAIEDDSGQMRERLKLSQHAAKTTIPGCLEVVRLKRNGLCEADIIYDSLTEESPCVDDTLLSIISPIDSWKRKAVRTKGLSFQTLLAPLFHNGQRVDPGEPLATIRQRSLASLGEFDPAILRFENPHAYAAGLSEALFARRENMKAREFERIRQRIVAANSTQKTDHPTAEGPIMKKALIITDIQNDFLPGGPLAVPEGDQILNYVVELIRQGDHYDLLIAVQDYHPADHGSFASTHPGCAPFDNGELAGLPQVFWPDHCIMGTAGAELAEPIRVTLKEAEQRGRRVARIQKGQNHEVDSYSAFFDNNRKQDTGLNKLLQDGGITQLDIVGLAFDYCVAATARDAIFLGFTTRILLNGTRAIDSQGASTLRKELEAEGIVFA